MAVSTAVEGAVVITLNLGALSFLLRACQLLSTAVFFSSYSKDDTLDFYTTSTNHSYLIYCFVIAIFGTKALALKCLLTKTTLHKHMESAQLSCFIFHFVAISIVR